jgi:hypothetical protein
MSRKPVMFGYSGVIKPLRDITKAVLVDIDGTLANNQHRQHYMAGEKQQWGNFFDAMGDDAVFPEIKFLVNTIFSNTSLSVILTTGRPSQYHTVTNLWLQNMGVCYSMLMMRSQGDDRSDVDVKRSMLRMIREQAIEPMFCIDDRPEVVEMWREEGIRTLQCDPSVWLKKQVVERDPREMQDEIDRLTARVQELEDEGGSAQRTA